MNIIIAGGGQVGVRLAQGLASEGHDITLVDRDSETIETASNKLDIICCLGSATSRDTLEQAHFYRNAVFAAMNELRIVVDELETLTSSKFWPYPSYGELLFSVK